MYNLYRKIGNKKRELMMTDSLQKTLKRKKELAKSHMRQKVSLIIEEASEDDDKFRKKPCNIWSNYNIPPRPKKTN